MEYLMLMIDPDDIWKIVVYKGTKTQALYREKWRNGVVLITIPKRGVA